AAASSPPLLDLRLPRASPLLLSVLLILLFTPLASSAVRPPAATAVEPFRIATLGAYPCTSSAACPPAYNPILVGPGDARIATLSAKVAVGRRRRRQALLRRRPNPRPPPFLSPPRGRGGAPRRCSRPRWGASDWAPGSWRAHPTQQILEDPPGPSPGAPDPPREMKGGVSSSICSDVVTSSACHPTATSSSC
ncbi:unnamed protein product, partial [Urochloa humidicola]